MAPGGLRTVIVVGALTAVALVVVDVLIVTADGDGGSPPDPTATDAITPQTWMCAVEVRGELAQIEGTDVGCAVAEGVYAEYQGQIEQRTAAASRARRRHAAWLATFVGRSFERVGGWRCLTFSYAGYPLLAECKSPNRHFLIRGTAPSAAPYFRPARSKSTRTDPLGAIRPERYFASKSKWRSYSRPSRLDAARSFINHTPAACRGASPEAMIHSMATGWLARGNPPADHAYHAMVDYCYDAST